MKFKSAAHNASEADIRKIFKSYTIVPDKLEIRGKKWKLEFTYQTMKDALATAEHIRPRQCRIFKYANGYALYEEDYLS